MAENIKNDHIVDSDDSEGSSFSIVSNSGIDLKMMAEKIDKLERQLENNQLWARADLNGYKWHFKEKLEEMNLAIDRQKNEANLREIDQNKKIDNMGRGLWKLDKENGELREQMREMAEKQQKIEEQIVDLMKKQRNGNEELKEPIGEKPTDEWFDCNEELNCGSAAKARDMEIANWEEQNPQPENNRKFLAKINLFFLNSTQNLIEMQRSNEIYMCHFLAIKSNLPSFLAKKTIGYDSVKNEMQIANVPVPDYLIAYTRIFIRHSLDEQIFQFLKKTILPNKIGVNLEISITNDKNEWQEDDARIPIMYRFLKMLAGKIFRISIFYGKIDAFIRFFPGILDQIQCIRVYSKEYSNLQTIYNWLIKSRADGKPKLIEFSGEKELAKHLIDFLKEEFPRSTHPINFLVFMTLHCGCQFAEFTMENDKSGEELKLYKKVFGTGKVVHILARHKKGNNLWIKNYEDKMFVDAASEIHIHLNLRQSKDQMNLPISCAAAGFSGKNEQNSNLNKQQNQWLAGEKADADLMKHPNGSGGLKEINGEQDANSIKMADEWSDWDGEFYKSKKKREEKTDESNAANNARILANFEGQNGEKDTNIMAKQESKQFCWPHWEKIDDPDIVVEYKLVLEIIRVKDEFGNFRSVIKTWPNEVIQLPNVPMPYYLIGFTNIYISFLDEQVLQFVEMLCPYINDIKFLFSIYDIDKWSGNDARIPIIHRFLKLLAPKIFALSYICHTDFNDFNRLFPGILEQIQYLAWRIDPSNIELILDWLKSPRKDGKQKLIYSGRSMWSDLEPILLERVKNEFINSNEAVNFLVLLRSFDYIEINEFTMENKKTGEELNFYKKVLPNGNVVHYLARYPKGEHWWKEKGEERICRTKTETSPEICINFYLMEFDEEQNASITELAVEEQNSDFEQANRDLIKKGSKKMEKSLENLIEVKVDEAEKKLLGSIEECLDANYLGDLKENKWNIQYCLPNVEMTRNSLGALYSGCNLNEAEEKWTTIMAEIPFNRQNIVFFQKEYLAGYYEVRILSKNRCISLGFCDQKFSLINYRVGDSRNSIGLHENGRISVDGNKNWMQSKNSYYIIGDVIGCGLIFAPFNNQRKNPESRILFFTTLNGKLIDFVYLPTKFVHIRLFPAVSLAHSGDSIKANFGAQKWLYDPTQLLNELKLE